MNNVSASYNTLQQQHAVMEGEFSATKQEFVVVRTQLSEQLAGAQQEKAEVERNLGNKFR